MQYIDALRLGALQRFCQIEEQSREWWFPTLDRGAGAALHFAADHGQVTEVVTLMTLPHGCDACRERCKHGAFCAAAFTNLLAPFRIEKHTRRLTAFW